MSSRIGFCVVVAATSLVAGCAHVPAVTPSLVILHGAADPLQVDGTTEPLQVAGGPVAIADAERQRIAAAAQARLTCTPYLQVDGREIGRAGILDVHAHMASHRLRAEVFRDGELVYATA